MKSISILLLLLCVFSLNAQSIRPQEGQTINYTQIMFESNEVHLAELYRFEFTEVEDSLFSHPMVQEDPTHVTLFDKFEFGKSYLWRVKAFDKHQNQLEISPIRHFTIRKVIAVDQDSYRYNIVDHGYNDVLPGIIFLDKNGVAIDRTGKPVWYLPVDRSLREGRLRDLKMTEEGTITFLTIFKCMEVNTEGKKLWETPKNSGIYGDSTDYFHHEFTKLANGNYTVLAKSVEHKHLELEDLKIDEIPISVVVEFNAAGDTVWGWNTRNYIQDDDLLKVGKKVFYGNTFGHGNSLAISPDGKYYYLGYRDLNAVLVIDRQTRQIINTYGDKVPSDTTKNAIGFFKKQHAAYPIGDGRILLFNNNDRGARSSVVIFSESESASEPSRILWEFPCDFDTLMPSASDRMGNAQYLKDHHILVNMGDVARLFEVTPDKRVVWDCLPEQWNYDSSKWVPISNYRLNFQSSLFPKYFSISTRMDTDGNNFIRVCNEGTDEDRYIVQIARISQPEKILAQREITLQPQDREDFYWTDKLSKRQLKKGIVITVTSKSNPSQHFEKIIHKRKRY